MKYKYLMSCLIFTAAWVDSAAAQKPVIASRDSVRAIFSGKKIVIQYGKPSVRGGKSSVMLYPSTKCGARVMVQQLC